ncbi:ExbD/TolR family protein [Yoonia sp.]|uniref:ExbD/TolR family protein n=1 Tax=Yoonia sp. TaxID=2212373 RepID=UPI004048D00A
MGDGVADALAAEPKTATTALPSVEEEPLTVTMTAQGVIFIQKTEVPTAELVTRLGAIAAGRTSNKIYLRADGANTWNSVAEVLGALQAGGFSDIGVVSDFGGTATAALVTSNSVADGLAAAVAASVTRAVQASPSLTATERDSFRLAVNSCWTIDLESVAASVVVKLGFTLNRDGTLDGEPRLLSSDGDQSATSTAFEAARRAILRCQRGGYQLPADKYDQWREVVITFDPSGMRLK